ncbi:PHO85 CYCLIN-5 [Ceraceosorus bombacis]|uniref:PHO85 CYCLIN-5 n=1 Tax=Ceraceosorus bombacis TaxID=401625 RepID=A0A0P1BBN4_9BASI|nr:PHO85 CYCLIN-5 [Ceraceosorus bombacis]
MAYTRAGHHDLNALGNPNGHTQGQPAPGQHAYSQHPEYQVQHASIAGQGGWGSSQHQLSDPAQTVAHSGVTMSGQPAAQMQDGGVVLMDSFGNQTGYWPPPQAPRLTAAAPRGGARNMWSAAWQNHPSNSAYLPQQRRTPWAADSWNQMHTTTHPSTAGYYQNQGAQYQHQSLLHEQLRKLQQDADAQLPQQQSSHLPLSEAWSQAPHNVANPAYSHMLSQNQHQIPAAHQSYPTQSRIAPQSAHHPSVDVHLNSLTQPQHLPYHYSADGNAYPAGHAQSHTALQPAAMGHTTSTYPVSQHAPAYQSQWPLADAQISGPQSYARPDADGFGTAYQPQPSSHQGTMSMEQLSAMGPSTWNRPAPPNWQVQPEHASQAHFPPRPHDWNGTAPTDPRRGSDQQVMNVPAPPPSAEQERIAPPADGPAPPSPATLDKSACPLSAMGAEIIWGASAALFDPVLISTQYELPQQRGRATSSAQSSPLLATPQMSPNLSSFASWTKAEATSGPALKAAATHELSKSPQHRSWNTGLTGELNTAPVSLLHRLAVEGAGAASAALAASQKPGVYHRESGDSSTGSNSSTSEPGTPPSIDESDLGIRASPKSRMDMSVGADERAAPPSSEESLNAGAANTKTGSSATPSMRQQGDRSKQAILAVLGLVSPYWKWSVNDDKLSSVITANVSSRTGTRDGSPTAVPMTATRTRRSSSTYSSRHAGHSGAMPGADVSPAFRRFCQQVLAQTLLSPTAFLLAILYAVRVPYLFRTSDALLCDEGREIFANPPSAAPFKLFTLGLMLSNKVIEDNTFLNKTWCDVTGIPLAELNRMESVYLSKCGYEVAVPHTVWVAYLRRIRAREEQKLNVLPFLGARRLSRGRMSAGSPAGQDQVLLSPSGGASTLESSRRFLVAIEDCLGALGELHEAPVEEPGMMDVTHPADDSSDDRTPRDGPSASSDSWFTTRYGIDSRTEAGRMQRPVAALQAAHQHCRSAPAAALHFRSPSQISPTTTSHDFDDVFDDDCSPIRPRNASSRGALTSTKVAHPLAHAARPSLDVNLTRSHSDWSDGLASFARVAPAHLTMGPNQQDQGAISQITSHAEAPLAPGILLAMLNQL